MIDHAFFASAWFRSRPPAVQEAYRKFMDKPIFLDGHDAPYFLVGVNENIATGKCGLWLSTTNPRRKPGMAMATKILVCSCCMKCVHVPTP